MAIGTESNISMPSSNPNQVSFIYFALMALGKAQKFFPPAISKIAEQIMLSYFG